MTTDATKRDRRREVAHQLIVGSRARETPSHAPQKPLSQHHQQQQQPPPHCGKQTRVEPTSCAAQHLSACATKHSVLFDSTFETTMCVDKALRAAMLQLETAAQNDELPMHQLAGRLAALLNSCLSGCQCAVALTNAARTELYFVDAHTRRSSGVQLLQKRCNLAKGKGGKLTPAAQCVHAMRTLCTYAPQLAVYIPLTVDGCSIGAVEIHGLLPEDERRWQHYQRDGESLFAMARADQSVLAHMRLWKACDDGRSQRKLVAGKVSNVLVRDSFHAHATQSIELFEIEWEDGTVHRGVTAQQLVEVMGRSKLSLGFGIVLDGRLQGVLEAFVSQCATILASRHYPEIDRRLRRSLQVHGPDLAGVVIFMLREVLDIFPDVKQAELVQYSTLSDTFTTLGAYPNGQQRPTAMRQQEEYLSADTELMQHVMELCRCRRSLACVQLPDNDKERLVSVLLLQREHTGESNLVVSSRVLLVEHRTTEAGSHRLVPELRHVADVFQACLEEARGQIVMCNTIKSAHRAVNDICAQWCSLSEVSLAERLCDTLSKVLLHTPLYVGLTDSTQQVLTFVAASSCSGMRGVTLSGGRGLAFAAMATQKPFVISESDGGVVRDQLNVGDAVHVLYGKKEYSAVIARVCGHGFFDITYDDGTSEAGVPSDRVFSQSSRFVMQTFGHVSYPVLFAPLQWEGLVTGVLVVESAAELSTAISSTSFSASPSSSLSSSVYRNSGLNVRDLVDAASTNFAKAILRQRHQKKLDAIRGILQLPELSLEDVASKCGEIQVDYFGPVEAAAVLSRTQTTATTVWATGQRGATGIWLRQVQQVPFQPSQRPGIAVEPNGVVNAHWPVWRAGECTLFVYRVKLAQPTTVSERLVGWLEEAAVATCHVLTTSSIGQSSGGGLEAAAVTLLDEQRRALDMMTWVRLKQFIPEVLDVCKSVLPSSNVHVAVMDPAEQHLALRYSTSKEFRETTFTAAAHPVLFEQLRQVATVFVQHASELTLELGKAFQSSLPLLVVPVLLGADVIKGLMIVDCAVMQHALSSNGLASWVDVVYQAADIIGEALQRCHETDVDAMIHQEEHAASFRPVYCQRILRNMLRHAFPNFHSAELYSVTMSCYRHRRWMPESVIGEQRRPWYLHVRVVAFSAPTSFPTRAAVQVRILDGSFKVIHRATIEREKHQLPTINVRVDPTEMGNFSTLVCELSCKHERVEVELDGCHLTSTFQQRVTYHFLTMSRNQRYEAVRNGSITLDAWMDCTASTQDAVPTIVFSVALMEVLGLCCKYWFAPKHIECVVLLNGNEIARVLPTDGAVSPSWPRQWMRVDTNIPFTTRQNTLRKLLANVSLTLEISGFSRTSPGGSSVSSSSSSSFPPSSSGRKLVVSFSGSQLYAACDSSGIVRGVLSDLGNPAAQRTAFSESVPPVPTVAICCEWSEESSEHHYQNSHARAQLPAGSVKSEYDTIIWVRLVSVINIRALCGGRPDPGERFFYLLVVFNGRIVGVVEFVVEADAEFATSLMHTLKVYALPRELMRTSARLSIELWQQNVNSSHEFIGRTVVNTSELTAACGHGQARDYLLSPATEASADLDLTMLRARFARTTAEESISNPFPLGADDAVEALVGDADDLFLIHDINASNLARADILKGSNPFLVCRRGRRVLARSDSVMHSLHPSWASLEFVIALGRDDDSTRLEADDVEIEVWSLGKRSNTLLGGVVLTLDALRRLAERNEPASLTLQLLQRHKRYSMPTAQGCLGFRVSHRWSEGMLRRRMSDAVTPLVGTMLKISPDSVRGPSAYPSSARSRGGADSSSDAGTDTERQEETYLAADSRPYLLILAVSGVPLADPVSATDMACVVKVHGSEDEIGRTSTVVSVVDTVEWPDERIALPIAPLPIDPAATWLTIEVWHALDCSARRQKLAVAECTWRVVRDAAQSGDPIQVELASISASQLGEKNRNLTKPSMTCQIVTAEADVVRGDGRLSTKDAEIAQSDADLMTGCTQAGGRTTLQLELLAASNVPWEPLRHDVHEDRHPERIYCTVAWGDDIIRRTHGVKPARNVVWLAETLQLPYAREQAEASCAKLRIVLRSDRRQFGWYEAGAADVERMLAVGGRHQCPLRTDHEMLNASLVPEKSTLVIAVRVLTPRPPSSSPITLCFHNLQPRRVQWAKFVVRRGAYLIGSTNSCSTVVATLAVCEAALQDAVLEEHSPRPADFTIEAWIQWDSSDAVEFGTVAVSSSTMSHLTTSLESVLCACRVAPVNCGTAETNDSAAAAMASDAPTTTVTFEIKASSTKNRVANNVSANRPVEASATPHDVQEPTRAQWIRMKVLCATGVGGMRSRHVSCAVHYGPRQIGETEASKSSDPNGTVTWTEREFMLQLASSTSQRDQQDAQLVLWNNDRSKRLECLGVVQLSTLDLIQCARADAPVVKMVGPTHPRQPANGLLLMHCGWFNYPSPQSDNLPSLCTVKSPIMAMVFDLLQIASSEVGGEGVKNLEWRVKWFGVVVRSGRVDACPMRVYLPIPPCVHAAVVSHHGPTLPDACLSVELWASTGWNSLALYGLWELPKHGLCYAGGDARWRSFTVPARHARAPVRALMKMDVQSITAVTNEAVADEQRPFNIHVLAASGLGLVNSTRLPNVYCVVKEGSRVYGSTDIAAASDSPAWDNAVFVVNVPVQRRVMVEVEVYDVDFENNRTTIGKVTLPAKLFATPSATVHKLNIVGNVAGLQSSGASIALGQLHLIIVEKARHMIDSAAELVGDLSSNVHRDIPVPIYRQSCLSRSRHLHGNSAAGSTLRLPPPLRSDTESEAEEALLLRLGRVINWHHCHILPEASEYLIFPISNSGCWSMGSQLTKAGCQEQAVLAVRRQDHQHRSADALLARRLGPRITRLLNNQVAQERAHAAMHEFQLMATNVTSEERLMEALFSALDVVAPAVAASLALLANAAGVLEVLKVNQYSGRVGQQLSAQQTWIGTAVHENRLVTIASPRDLRFHSVVFLGSDGQLAQQQFPAAVIPVTSSQELPLGAIILEGLPSVNYGLMLSNVKSLSDCFADALVRCKLKEWSRQMRLTVLERHPTHTLQVLSHAVLDLARVVRSVEIWECSAGGPRPSSVLFCSSTTVESAIIGRSEVRDVEVELQRAWLDECQQRLLLHQGQATAREGCEIHFVLTLLSGSAETSVPLTLLDGCQQMHFKGPLACKLASDSRAKFTLYCVCSDWTIVAKATGSVALATASASTAAAAEPISATQEECRLVDEQGTQVALLRSTLWVRDTYDQTELRQFFDALAKSDVHLRIESASHLQPGSRFRNRSQAYCVVRCGAHEVFRTSTVKGGSDLRWGEVVAVDGERCARAARSATAPTAVILAIEIWVTDRLGRFKLYHTVNLTAEHLQQSKSLDAIISIPLEQQLSSTAEPSAVFKLSMCVQQRGTEVIGGLQVPDVNLTPPVVAPGVDTTPERMQAVSNAVLKIHELLLRTDQTQLSTSASTEAILIKCFHEDTQIGQTTAVPFSQYVRWPAEILALVTRGKNRGDDSIHLEIWSRSHGKAEKLVGSCLFLLVNILDPAGWTTVPVFAQSKVGGGADRTRSWLQVHYKTAEVGTPFADENDIFAIVEIQIVQCSGLPKLDAFHSPSPCCVVRLDGQVCGGTRPVKRTMSPTWEHTSPVALVLRQHHVLRPTPAELDFEIIDATAGSGGGGAILGRTVVSLADALQPAAVSTSYELSRIDRHGQVVGSGELTLRMSADFITGVNRHCYPPAWLRLNQQTVTPSVFEAIPIRIIPDPDAEANRAAGDRICMDNTVASLREQTAAYLSKPFDRLGMISELHHGQLFKAVYAGQWTTLRFEAAEIHAGALDATVKKQHDTEGDHQYQDQQQYIMLLRAPTGSFTAAVASVLRELLDTYTAATATREESHQRQVARASLQAELAKLRKNDVDYFINLCELLEAELPACGFGPCSVDVRRLQPQGRHLDSIINERRAVSTRIELDDLPAADLLELGFVVALSSDQEQWVSHVEWTEDYMLPLSIAADCGILPSTARSSTRSKNQESTVQKAMAVHTLVMIPVWKQQCGAVGLVWIECSQALPFVHLKLSDSYAHTISTPELGIAPLLRVIAAHTLEAEGFHQQRVVRSASQSAPSLQVSLHLDAVRDAFLACCMWLCSSLWKAVPGMLHLEIWVMITDGSAQSATAATPTLHRFSSDSRRSLLRGDSTRSDRIRSSLSRLLSSRSASALLGQWSDSGSSTSPGRSFSSSRTAQMTANYQICRFKLTMLSKAKGELHPVTSEELDGVSAEQLSCQQWLRCQQLSTRYFRAAPSFSVAPLECSATVSRLLARALLPPHVLNVAEQTPTASFAAVAASAAPGTNRKWGMLSADQQATIAEISQQFCQFVESQFA